MCAHRHMYDGARALDEVLVEDPGTGNTIVLHPNCMYQVCELTTAAGGGTETRAVPAPTNQPVGARLLVTLRTNAATDVDITFNGGSAITGSTAIVTFDTAGKSVDLKCVRIGSGKVWRLVGNDGGTLS